PQYTLMLERLYGRGARFEPYMHAEDPGIALPKVAADFGHVGRRINFPSFVTGVVGYAEPGPSILHLVQLASFPGLVIPVLVGDSSKIPKPPAVQVARSELQKVAGKVVKEKRLAATTGQSHM